MKNWLYICFVFFVVSCAGAQDKQTAEVKPNGKDPNADWLTIYNADSARNDYKTGKCRLMVYGMRAMMMPQQQNDSLCKAYNFYEYDAAGCEVTQLFQAGVKAYNDEMIKLLERKNGTGWYDRYIADVEKLRLAWRKKQEE